MLSKLKSPVSAAIIWFGDLMRDFTENTEAVSPVIGVILMVAITVILASVIAVFVFGLAGNLESSMHKDVIFKTGVDNTGKLITIQAFAGKDLGRISYITATNGSSYWLPKGITKNSDAGWLHVGRINTTTIPRNDKTVVFTATFSDGTEQVVAQT